MRFSRSSMPSPYSSTPQLLLTVTRSVAPRGEYRFDQHRRQAAESESADGQRRAARRRRRPRRPHWRLPCPSITAFSTSSGRRRRELIGRLTNCSPSTYSAATNRATTSSTTTESPSRTRISTVPSRGATRTCSIFIADTTTSASPACTSCPDVARTLTTVPGIGLRTSLEDRGRAAGAAPTSSSMSDHVSPPDADPRRRTVDPVPGAA